MNIVSDTYFEFNSVKSMSLYAAYCEIPESFIVSGRHALKPISGALAAAFWNGTPGDTVKDKLAALTVTKKVGNTFSELKTIPTCQIPDYAGIVPNLRLMFVIEGDPGKSGWQMLSMVASTDVTLDGPELMTITQTAAFVGMLLIETFTGDGQLLSPGNVYLAEITAVPTLH